MSTSPTRIGIAVVEHAGAYLVGTRSDSGPLAGFDEFPGGKCRSEESTEACAMRECLEETGLSVRAVRLLEQTRHSYSHGELALDFWLCEPLDPATIQRSQNGFSWIAASQLNECHFPDANASVVRKLVDFVR